MNKELYPVIIFTVFFVTAIILGNWFLSAVLNRPIDDVPAILKVIVHGVTLSLLALAVKKFYAR